MLTQQAGAWWMFFLRVTGKIWPRLRCTTAVGHFGELVCLMTFPQLRHSGNSGTWKAMAAPPCKIRPEPASSGGCGRASELTQWHGSSRLLRTGSLRRRRTELHWAASGGKGLGLGRRPLGIGHGVWLWGAGGLGRPVSSK